MIEEAARQAAARVRGPRLWPVLLTALSFWPALFSIIILATSADRTLVTWGAAVLFSLLFIFSAAETVLLNLPSHRVRSRAPADGGLAGR